MDNDMIDIGVIKSYLDMQWPVIPCRIWFKDGETSKAEKTPLVQWQRFQETMPSLSEWSEWLAKWPECHIGIVTGPLTGIIIVDIDPGHSIDDLRALRLPPTVTSKTPRGGQHMFFRSDRAREIKTTTNFRKNIDIRANGGFAVIAPSTYPDGRSYEWLISPEFEDIAELPDHLFELLDKRNDSTGGTDFRDIIKGVGSGMRNDSAAKVAGLLLKGLNVRHWNHVAWRLTRLWNQQNTPPMDDMELQMVFNSIANKEFKRRKKAAQERDAEYQEKEKQKELDSLESYGNGYNER